MLGADVTVTGRGHGATVIGPLNVKPDPADPTFYDLRITLDKEGVWIFTVDVSAPAGEGSANFAIEIEKSGSISTIITLLTLLAFVVILGFSARGFFGRRGEQGKRLRVNRRRS